MIPKRILCIHLPNWPIQRLRAARKAGATSNPLVILHARDPRRGELVVACNQAAAACGVRVGMPLAEASALVAAQRAGKQMGNHADKRVGKGQVLIHDPAADRAALAKLAEHCERFSPIVGWETVEGGAAINSRGPKSNVQSPKGTENLGRWTLDLGLFLDVTGIGILFGGEEALIREVTADLARLGYAPQVSIAGTIGAAWAAAMRNAGPRRCIAFPIAALRLPPETLDLLAQLGIARIEHLLALPRASLRARFGERLLLRLDQLTGAAQETIVAHRPPPHFAAERVLEYPVEQREAAEGLVRELVERVARDLAERRAGVVQLHIRLDCAPGQPLLLEVGLFRPSADVRHLWEVVRMQLEQKPLPGPVGRITLEARLTAPLENRQGELFAGNEREAERQYALLIDRLASRLGPAAVLRAELTADPLPERAVRWVAGVRGQGSGVRSQESGFRRRKRDPGRQALSTESAIRTPHSAIHRPLTLLSPVALEVLSVVPDGPPLTFRWQGRQHQVVRHWGPERIETGWWRGASVRRDYYRVETAAGQRFWLFRQLGSGQWQLHGEFS